MKEQTPTKFLVLLVLDDLHRENTYPPTQVAIADRLDLTKQTIGYHFSALIESGLVRSAGRLGGWIATDAGSRVAERLRKRFAGSVPDHRVAI